MFFLCFGVLLVDRALSKRSENGSVRGRDKFQQLLNTMPACAAPLRDALVSKGRDLTFGHEGEPFFDQQRLDVLERCAAPSGSADKPRGMLLANCTDWKRRNTDVHVVLILPGGGNGRVIW